MVSMETSRCRNENGGCSFDGYNVTEAFQLTSLTELHSAVCDKLTHHRSVNA